MTLKLCLLLFCAVSFAESARILGVFPAPSPSHYFLGSALMRGLAEKGHDVTMISAFGEKNLPKNWKYRDIVLDGIRDNMMKKFQEDGEGKKFNIFARSGAHPLITMFFMNFIGNEITNSTLAHPNTQKLLNSNEKFDVVIVEQFVDDALKGFANHFGAPLILFSTVGASSWINPLVANPSPPSYIPEVLLSYSSDMTFIQRIKNSLYNLAAEVNRHLIFFPAQNKILKQYFPNSPDLSIINYNASLVILNSHVSSNQPVPLQPCMIEIGGFHVQPPKKLPDDLQKYLDEAEEGVIYFSMGSNLQSKELPDEKKEALLTAFKKLKYKVLWKWEDDVLPNQPANVKVGKWFPQQDILAHPNVKLFMTHGGLLSTTEALYHGVPVLAIPVFGDQDTNAALAVNNEYGISIKYTELNEKLLTNALSKILSNPKLDENFSGHGESKYEGEITSKVIRQLSHQKYLITLQILFGLKASYNLEYKENAQMRSKIMHDRVVKPIDLATYWIEYVIRHNGAPHLRSAGLQLSWYQYHLLDVISVLFVVFLIIIYVNYIILKKIIRRICKKTVTKKLKKN